VVVAKTAKRGLLTIRGILGVNQKVTETDSLRLFVHVKQGSVLQQLLKSLFLTMTSCTPHIQRPLAL